MGGAVRLRAAVVGTGLIGGSVLLRLADTGADVRGWDPDAGTRARGREWGLSFPDRLADAVRDRDVVFLAGPLSTLPATAVEVAALTPPACLLTDVGSTKAEVAAAVRRSGLGDRFVPGHPMAGAERSGLAAADSELFRGAAWVLCPDGAAGDGAAGEAALPAFRRLVRIVVDVFGAHVVPMAADLHDEVAALSSHVPHLLARALAGAAQRSAVRPALLALAAGSFRDGTRVAGTPSYRTSEMLLGNRDAVLRQLAAVEGFAGQLAAALRDADAAALTRLLDDGSALRAALPTTGAGPPPGTAPYDVRFAPAGGADELSFLLDLGAGGGCLLGCDEAGDTVTYHALRPPP